MTLNLAAIFGTEPADVVVAAGDPVVIPTARTEPMIGPSPIVPGTEHWNPYIDAADLDAGRWGVEFAPGYHADIRQPSTLRPLCSPGSRNERSAAISAAQRPGGNEDCGNYRRI